MCACVRSYMRSIVPVKVKTTITIMLTEMLFKHDDIDKKNIINNNKWLAMLIMQM